jgi:hypothetical protein
MIDHLEAIYVKNLILGHLIFEYLIHNEIAYCK